MTERAYTAEELAARAISRKLAGRFSQMMPSDTEWRHVLHHLANELQLALTASEEREVELEQDSPKCKQAMECLRQMERAEDAEERENDLRTEVSRAKFAAKIHEGTIALMRKEIDALESDRDAQKARIQAACNEIVPE